MQKVVFFVKYFGEKVAEFNTLKEAEAYREENGGAIYKRITTIKEYKQMGGGLWGYLTYNPELEKEEV